MTKVRVWFKDYENFEDAENPNDFKGYVDLDRRVIIIIEENGRTYIPFESVTKVQELTDEEYEEERRLGEQINAM